MILVKTQRSKQSKHTLTNNYNKQLPQTHANKQTQAYRSSTYTHKHKKKHVHNDSKNMLPSQTLAHPQTKQKQSHAKQTHAPNRLRSSSQTKQTHAQEYKYKAHIKQNNTNTRSQTI